jgi:tetratricopeptide (TPR) repeat protein
MAKKNSNAENQTIAQVNPVQTAQVENTPVSLNLNQLESSQKWLLGAAGIVILAIAGFFGYRYYASSQDEEAQALMSPAVYYFEADSLKKALNGDGANDGLETIAEQYSMTKAGNLAALYTGIIYMKQGKLNEAIEYLKKFTSDDLLVQGRAYCLIGDAYMEKNELAEAIRYYRLASEYKPNKFFTPQYLMKLALAYELKKDFQAALETYDQLLEKYRDSQESQNAKKYKSKLEGLTEK